jgi:hypothetical protein
MGMFSDFFYDLNNSSNTSSLTATISDIVSDGEASDDTANFALDIAHNAKTGDSSIEISVGQGTDTNASGGIYITQGTALLRSASTDRKLIEYAMPAASDKTLMGGMTALLTGLFSDDGKAVSLGDNLTDRQDLAARFLDPWMNETKPEAYKDTKETLSLLGKDVECRVITLSMEGQAAYDFVLAKMQLLNDDAQFKEMNGLLGGSMGLMADGGSSDSDTSSDSATGDLIDELKALTPDEISKALFNVSVIFDGDKAIGLKLEASTTGKAFKIDLLTYRKGLEHQINVYLQAIDGTSVSFDLSKVKADGAYSITGAFKSIDKEGAQSAGGQITGTITESATKHDFKGNFTSDFQIEDSDGVKQPVSVSVDMSMTINKSGDSGYDGTGEAAFELKGQDNQTSMKMALTLGMKKSADVVITPPMVIEGNVAKVTNKQELFEAFDQDWSDVSDQSPIIQGLQLVVLLIMS